MLLWQIQLHCRLFLGGKHKIILHKREKTLKIVTLKFIYNQTLSTHSWCFPYYQIFVKYKSQFCHYNPECFPKYQVSIWKIYSRITSWSMGCDRSVQCNSNYQIYFQKYVMCPPLQVTSHSLRIPFFWDMTVSLNNLIPTFQCNVLSSSTRIEIYISQGVKCRLHFDPWR